jgi:hypothetical protein
LSLIFLTVFVSALITLSDFGSDSTAAADDSLATKVNAAYAAPVAGSGLTSMAVADRFDAKYLDISFTKTMPPDASKVNAMAPGTNSELPLFPVTQVTNPVISNCDSKNVCTLNATLVNSDADITSVDFSTKVILVSGVFYFYGEPFSPPSL